MKVWFTHEAGTKFVNLKRCQDRDGHVLIDGVEVGYYFILQDKCDYSGLMNITVLTGQLRLNQDMSHSNLNC